MKIYDLARVVAAANLILQLVIMVTIKGWTPLTVVHLIAAVGMAYYISEATARIEQET